MTVREALSNGASVVTGTGSDTPFLDASLLLAGVLGLSREALLARGGEELPGDAEAEYSRFLDRRARGESVAYLLGYKEFYGRAFRVDPRVLVPRPDTEILVEAALESAARLAERLRDAVWGIGSDAGPYTGLRVHDAFTGSGCVGITLAAELLGAEVSLSDISRDALDVAERNAQDLLKRRLNLTLCDVLDAVAGPFDLISANPPYVTRSETDRMLGSASGASPATTEPRSALDGGLDGLRFYRRLVPEAEKRLAPGGVLAVEIGDEQGTAVADILGGQGFRGVEILPDLAGRDRVVRGTRA